MNSSQAAVRFPEVDARTATAAAMTLARSLAKGAAERIDRAERSSLQGPGAPGEQRHDAFVAAARQLDPPESQRLEGRQTRPGRDVADQVDAGAHRQPEERLACACAGKAGGSRQGGGR